LVSHSPFKLGDEIGRQLGIMALAMVIFVIINNTVLRRAAVFFSRDGELLFIGTMAYGLGAAGLCALAGASPMMGAYLAGLSLSFLPFQAQILEKIASLKAFGTTLFYFMLGVYVNVDARFFQQNFGWSVLVTVLVVLVCPLGFWVMGWCAGLKARTVVKASLLFNNLGETTLTLQVLGYQSGIFSADVFLVLVAASTMSIALSCLGAALTSDIFPVLHRALAVLDAPSLHEREREQEQVFEKHVLILGFNEVALEVAEAYRRKGRDVVVVDLDYCLHDSLRFAYKGTKPRQAARAVPLHEADLLTDHHHHQQQQQQKQQQQQQQPSSGIKRDAAVELSSVSPRFAMRELDLVGGSGSAPRSEDLPAQPSPQRLQPTVGVSGMAFGNKGSNGTLDRFGSFVERGNLGLDGAGGGKGDDTSPAWAVDGAAMGICTNIYSVYADPELQWTWDRYNCKGAEIVVSCLVGRDQMSLCHYLAASPTPVVAVCDSSATAKTLYAAGATYVVRQNALAASTVRRLFEVEFSAGDIFATRALDHKDALSEEQMDAARKVIADFY